MGALVPVSLNQSAQTIGIIIQKGGFYGLADDYLACARSSYRRIDFTLGFVCFRYKLGCR